MALTAEWQRKTCRLTLRLRKELMERLHARAKERGLEVNTYLAALICADIDGAPNPAVQTSAQLLMRPPTYDALIKSALAARSLTLAGVIEAVWAVRPGANRRSIETAIYALHADRELTLTPPSLVRGARGGTYSLSGEEPAKTTESFASTSPKAMGRHARRQTTRALILDVARDFAAPFTTSQMFAALQARDPTRLRDTIKHEIARMRDDASLVVHGFAEGGVHLHSLPKEKANS